MANNFRVTFLFKDGTKETVEDDGYAKSFEKCKKENKHALLFCYIDGNGQNAYYDRVIGDWFISDNPVHW